MTATKIMALCASLALFSACVTDDGTTDEPSKGGKGGKTGTSTGGKGGTGAKGGTGGTGGTGDTGGTGGTEGEYPLTQCTGQLTPANACTDCLAGLCCDGVVACMQDGQPCQRLLACAQSKCQTGTDAEQNTCINEILNAGASGACSAVFSDKGLKDLMDLYGEQGCAVTECGTVCQ